MAVCRNCSAELPADARFCPACGAPIAARTGEERKVVTILFADLAGSTALGDASDPEDVRALIRPQLDRMRRELELYGGTFEKYVGDAVMAVFGAPVAHEDDADRAVRAALAIRDALPGVRVAVNTGEAVVSLEAGAGAAEGIATGDVVNTAFRIEEGTATGTVLVGEATHRSTAATIDYSGPRELEAKGKAEPIVVYEARSARGGQRPLDDETPVAPLVGRREELSLILDTLARARRDRTVQLLTLVGVPGIGKSRLVWELQRALQDEPELLTWRRGRCLPYGEGVTYWALGEMVKAHAGILETDDAAAAETALHRTVREVIEAPAEAAWVEGHLRPLLGLATAAPIHRDEAFAGWRRFFEALADRGLLVLAFEDLHWADEGLLDFLDHLADWALESPIVLLCTARPELHDRRSGWGARPNAATILLPPLTGSETGVLVAFLLQQKLVPPELQDALLARAEGNPLYAQEFVRMLVERGDLFRNGSGWQLRTSDLAVPESVQAIIAARLDGLAPLEKAVVRDASVVGRGFWPAAVAAVSGFPREEVESRLRALERKELVRRLAASALGGEPQYSFHHALVRDVAYGQIPRSERARKHCLAAEWIEALGRPEDHSETIAHHYLRALEYARASGQDSWAFASAARTALADAGARALALASGAHAERYYEAALDLAPADGLERARILAGLGKARAVRGDGVAELEAASAKLLAEGARGEAAEAAVVCARSLLMQGRHAEAAERFDRALALLEAEGVSAEKATVVANVAGFRMATDRGAEAIELAREALAMAEQLGLPDLEVSALATIGTARVSTGDLTGVADLERAIEIAEVVGSPEVVRAYLNLGSLLATLGDVRRARALHARGRAAAERFGDPARLRWFVAERLYELYWSEEWESALDAANEMLADIEQGAPHVSAFDAHLVRGWILLASGDVPAAANDADRALELGRTFAAPQLLYPALAFAARVALATGEHTRAGELSSELVEAWAGTARTTLPSFWVAELALVLHALGRGGEFERAAEAAPKTRWLDAAVAVASGHDARARELYEEIGSQPDAALAAAAAATTP